MSLSYPQDQILCCFCYLKSKRETQDEHLYKSLNKSLLSRAQHAYAKAGDRMFERTVIDIARIHMATFLNIEETLNNGRLSAITAALRGLAIVSHNELNIKNFL